MEIPPTHPPSTVLEVRGLRRHFGKVPAVDGIDLTVREGEIYGFLGINGAGKTTTIRALMGIIATEAGTISLLGETTRRTSVAQKRRIGYVSQEQNFYPWMKCHALGKFVGAFYPTWDAAEFARLLSVLEVPAERRGWQKGDCPRAEFWKEVRKSNIFCVTHRFSEAFSSQRNAGTPLHVSPDFSPKPTKDGAGGLTSHEPSPARTKGQSTS